MQFIRYGITGGIIAAINFMGYSLLLRIGMVYTAANIISLIVSKLAGYLLNKFWVYRSKSDGFIHLLSELIRFILARGFTGLVDFFGVIMMVEFFNCDEYISKIIIMLLVIILNYVLGKKAVFVNKAE